MLDRASPGIWRVRRLPKHWAHWWQIPGKYQAMWLKSSEAPTSIFAKPSAPIPAVPLALSSNSVPPWGQSVLSNPLTGLILWFPSFQLALCLVFRFCHPFRGRPMQFDIQRGLPTSNIVLKEDSGQKISMCPAPCFRPLLLPVKLFYLAWAGTVSNLQNGNKSDGGRIRQARKLRGRRGCHGREAPKFVIFGPLNTSPPWPWWSNLSKWLTYLYPQRGVCGTSSPPHSPPLRMRSPPEFFPVSECSWGAVWSPVSFCRWPLSGLRWELTGQKHPGEMHSVWELSPLQLTSASPKLDSPSWFSLSCFIPLRRVVYESTECCWPMDSHSRRYHFLRTWEQLQC
jgi:hypothetical protein